MGGRKVMQRCSRWKQSVAQCNRVVDSLNSLYGCDAGHQVLPSAAQDAVLRSILQQCALDRPPAGMSVDPEAALLELLGSKASGYEEPEGQHGPAAYRRDLVSLPDSAGSCFLLEHLCDSDRDDLDRFRERLFLSESA